MEIVNAAVWLLTEIGVLLMFFRLYKRKKSRDEKTEVLIYGKKEIIQGTVCSAIAVMAGVIVAGSIGFWTDSLKLLIAFAGLSAAAIIDYKIQLIPNVLVLAMMAARLVVFIPEFILRRDEIISIMIGSILSAVIIFVVLLILSFLSREGIGMGDVKIFTATGFCCGVYAVLNTMLMALILCVLVSLGLIAMKKKKLKDKIPFGPFIFIGYLVTLILGAY